MSSSYPGGNFGGNQLLAWNPGTGQADGEERETRCGVFELYSTQHVVAPLLHAVPTRRDTPI